MKEKLKTLWIVVVGVILIIIGLYNQKDYKNAQIKINTTATIINVDETKLFKNDGKNNKKPYYSYKITWEFEDDNTGVKTTFKTNDKSDSDNKWKLGQTKKITAYSNDGENYEVYTSGGSYILLGSLFIIGTIYVFYAENKKSKKDEKLKKIAHERMMQNKQNTQTDESSTQADSNENV